MRAYQPEWRETTPELSPIGGQLRNNNPSYVTASLTIGGWFFFIAAAIGSVLYSALTPHILGMAAMGLISLVAGLWRNCQSANLLLAVIALAAGMGVMYSPPLRDEVRILAYSMSVSQTINSPCGVRCGQ